ncbi:MULTISPECIES: hypothetical protein [Pseudomonas aeruginosa group]|uniref:hypothetical protein n=1 Tax=Pseudomonas aeruginosa group TaxID=136841 RepID=UPI0000D72E13|nr:MULTISPECIES: hypothetical protein [Pseudomonas aeruginosa group]MBH8717163.1 hypothetical protein [Pseudomonas aeruginosa]MBH9343590.1 hypothetical protein [Pseudomonas aeruginosa]MBH9396565.1 hypothetical protein [Pseudomonas aeruginosa]MBI8116566.1 hypothetical protein [Pseudomonas aeruginosa]MCW8361245.1 hypothetical protein [Pseudomonas aeruginosa]
MQGYQLTFITQQGRHHQGQPLCDWLLDEAIRQAGVRLFYMKVPVEFGALGADEPAS